MNVLYSNELIIKKDNMKAVNFFLVMLFMIFGTLQAQTVKIGLKGGINYSNFTGAAIKTDAITSYHAGLVGQFRIADSFALQPELLYSTQGANIKEAVNEFKSELGYLSIPVLMKINLSESLSLETGPQASFLLSKRKEFSLGDYNTFDFGVCGGLGLKITDHLFVQARYVLGLTEISKDAKAKNSVFQLSAGVFF